MYFYTFLLKNVIMICFPNCKINLGLTVTGKRTDGFHNIETVFYPVKLCDALEIVVSPDENFAFETTGIEIDSLIDDNLCSKAFKLLADEHNLPAIKIHLHKNIPIGAGLGGGSADAAFTIKLLNEVFDLKLSVENMKDYARKLGSDCTFFIDNAPVFAFGKGDFFEPVNVNLDGYFVLIAKPDIFINTAKAYAGVIISRKQISIKEIINLPIKSWRQNLKNDFENNIFKSHPEIQNIKNKMYESGAIYSAMSGSGSAVYGIFEKDIQYDGLFPDCLVWKGRLL